MDDIKKAVVIGAGPAGLSCAHQLAEHGLSVDLFEASAQVGGLSRSLVLWGQTVDLGPHRFFSRDRIVNEFWLRFAGRDFSWVKRLTRIRYKGRFFRYPLQPIGAFRDLGWRETLRSGASYARSLAFPIASPRTFEDWVSNRFGRRLYLIFFKSYTEKLWGVPCDRLDAAWAAQRIRGFSLWEGVLSALLRRSKSKHKTLVDQFAYPKGGSGRVYRAMQRDFERLGGDTHLETSVKEVIVDADNRVRGVTLGDGARVEADLVVSSMPITVLVRALKGCPQRVKDACDKLRFRNTVLVYLEVPGEDLFPDNWIYVHEPSVRLGRVTNFRNWCPSLANGAATTILCAEFWCFSEDALWTESDAKLAARAVDELRLVLETPLEPLNSHVLRVPRSYPVYETGYAAHLDVIKSYLSTIEGLLLIGRYGAFKYNNQDHSILMGLLAAKEIVSGVKQNLWDVNSDGEYQEQASIEDLLADPVEGRDWSLLEASGVRG